MFAYLIAIILLAWNLNSAIHAEPISISTTPDLTYAQKANDLVIISTLSDAAAIQSLEVTSLDEKKSLTELSKFLNSKAQELHQELEAPFSAVENLVEAWSLFHFIVRLSQWEKDRGNEKEKQFVLSSGASLFGISPSDLLSIHEELKSLMSNFPFVQEFDRNIDLLLNGVSFAQTGDHKSQEDLLWHIPRGPFRDLIIRMTEFVAQDVRKKTILSERFGSSEINIDRFLQGIVSNSKEDLEYFQTVDGFYPDLKKVIYISLLKRLNDQPAHLQAHLKEELALLPQNPNDVSQAEVAYLLWLLSQKYSRSLPPELSIAKKSDFWRDVYHAPSETIFIHPGILGLTLEAWIVGTPLAVLETVCIFNLPGYVTAGVLAYSAAMATAPNLDHATDSQPKPTDTWGERFSTNVVTMLPMALLFQAVSPYFPKTAWTTVSLLGLWQTYDFIHNKKYFEALFTGLVTAQMTFQTTRLWSAYIKNTPITLGPKFSNKEIYFRDTPFKIQKTSILTDGTLAETPDGLNAYRFIYEPKLNRVRLVVDHPSTSAYPNGERSPPDPFSQDPGNKPGKQNDDDLIPRSKSNFIIDDGYSLNYDDTTQNDPGILHPRESTFEPSSPTAVFDSIRSWNPLESILPKSTSTGNVETLPKTISPKTRPVLNTINPKTSQIIPRTVSKESFGISIPQSRFSNLISDFEFPQNFAQLDPSTSIRWATQPLRIGNKEYVLLPPQKMIIVTHRDQQGRAFFIEIKFAEAKEFQDLTSSAGDGALDFENQDQIHPERDDDADQSGNLSNPPGPDIRRGLALLYYLKIITNAQAEKVLRLKALDFAIEAHREVMIPELLDILNNEDLSDIHSEAAQHLATLADHTSPLTTTEGFINRLISSPAEWRGFSTTDVEKLSTQFHQDDPLREISIDEAVSAWLQFIFYPSRELYETLNSLTHDQCLLSLHMAERVLDQCLNEPAAAFGLEKIKSVLDEHERTAGGFPWYESQLIAQLLYSKSQDLRENAYRLLKKQRTAYQDPDVLIEKIIQYHPDHLPYNLYERFNLVLTCSIDELQRAALKRLRHQYEESKDSELLGVLHDVILNDRAQVDIRHDCFLALQDLSDFKYPQLQKIADALITTSHPKLTEDAVCVLRKIFEKQTEGKEKILLRKKLIYILSNTSFSSETRLECFRALADVTSLEGLVTFASRLSAEAKDSAIEILKTKEGFTDDLIAIIQKPLPSSKDDDTSSVVAPSWSENPFFHQGQLTRDTVSSKNLLAKNTPFFKDPATGLRVFIRPDDNGFVLQVEDSQARFIPIKPKQILPLGRYVVVAPEENPNEIYFVNLSLFSAMVRNNNSPQALVFLFPLHKDAKLEALSQEPTQAGVITIHYQQNISMGSPPFITENFLDAMSLVQMQLEARAYAQQNGGPDWNLENEITRATANIDYVTGLKGIGSLLVDHIANLIPLDGEDTPIPEEHTFQPKAPLDVSQTLAQTSRATLSPQITDVKLPPEIEAFNHMLQTVLPPFHDPNQLFGYLMKNMVRPDSSTLDENRDMANELLRVKEQFEKEAIGRFSYFKSSLDSNLLLSQEEGNVAGPVNPKGLTAKIFYAEEGDSPSQHELALKDFYGPKTTSGFVAEAGQTIQRLELWSRNDRVRTFYIPSSAVIATGQYLTFLPPKESQGSDALPRIIDLKQYPVGPVPVWFGLLREDLTNCEIVSVQSDSRLLSIDFKRPQSSEITSVTLSQATMRDLVNAQALLFNTLAFLKDPRIEQTSVLSDTLVRINSVLDQISELSEIPNESAQKLKQSMAEMVHSYMLRPAHADPDTQGFAKVQKEITDAMVKSSQVSTQYKGLVRSLLLSTQKINGYKPLGGRGILLALAVAAATYGLFPETISTAAYDTVSLIQATGQWISGAFSTFAHLSSQSTHAITAAVTDTPTATKNLWNYRTPIMVTCYIGAYVVVLGVAQQVIQSYRLAKDFRSKEWEKFHEKWALENADVTILEDENKGLSWRWKKFSNVTWQAAKDFVIERQTKTMMNDGSLRLETQDGQEVLVKYKFDRKTGQPINRKVVDFTFLKAFMSVYTSWSSILSTTASSANPFWNATYWIRALMSLPIKSTVYMLYPNFKLVARRGVVPSRMNGGLWLLPTLPIPDPMLYQTRNQDRVLNAELIVSQKITLIAAQAALAFATGREEVRDISALIEAISEGQLDRRVLAEVLTRRTMCYFWLIHDGLFEAFESKLKELNKDKRHSFPYRLGVAIRKTAKGELPPTLEDTSPLSNEEGSNSNSITTTSLDPMVRTMVNMVGKATSFVDLLTAEEPLTIPNEETIDQWLSATLPDAVQQAKAFAQLSSPLKWSTPEGRKWIKIQMRNFLVHRYSKLGGMEKRVTDCTNALAEDPLASERAAAKTIMELIFEMPFDLALLLILNGGANGEMQPVGQHWMSDDSMFYINNYYLYGLGTYLLTMPGAVWVKIIEDRLMLRNKLKEGQEFDEIPPENVKYYLSWLIRQTAFNPNNRLIDIYKRMWYLNTINIVPNFLLKSPLQILFLGHISIDIYFWGYLLSYAIGPIHSWIDQGIDKSKGFEKRGFTKAQLLDPEVKRLVRQRFLRRRGQVQMTSNILWNVEGLYVSNLGMLPGADGRPREGIRHVYGGLTGGRDVLPTQDAVSMLHYLAKHHPGLSGFFSGVETLITHKHPLYKKEE